jgi:8-oxo-dGTP diphosphatase
LPHAFYIKHRCDEINPQQAAAPVTRPDQLSAVVPQAAVSAAIFRDGRVLLVQRGRGAAKGLWSLPGGHIEPGEAAETAAHRELAEETGIEAKLCGILGVKDVVQQNDRGDLLFHRVIIVFHGLWSAGEARAGSDAAAAAWVDPATLDNLPVTEGLAAMLARADKAVPHVGGVVHRSRNARSGRP